MLVPTLRIASTVPPPLVLPSADQAVPLQRAIRSAVVTPPAFEKKPPAYTLVGLCRFPVLDVNTRPVARARTSELRPPQAADHDPSQRATWSAAATPPAFVKSPPTYR